MQSLIRNEYKYNSYFRKFVDEYCRKEKCTLEKAFNDEYVKRKFWMSTEV